MTLSNGATSTIVVIAVVMAGLMAGLEIGTGFQHSTAQVLPEAAWTRMHQAEDGLFRVMIPPAFIFTVLMLVFCAVVTRGPIRTLFAIAAACTVAEIIATIVLNVPINNQVQGWSAGSAPANWMTLRDAWLRNHWWRSTIGVAGFVLAVIGATRLR